MNFDQMGVYSVSGLLGPSSFSALSLHKMKLDTNPVVTTQLRLVSCFERKKKPFFSTEGLLGKVYHRRGAGQFDEIQKQPSPTSAGVKSDLRYKVL